MMLKMSPSTQSASSSHLHLSNTWVSVLPEGEEFLVMLYGFSFSAFPFGKFCPEPDFINLFKEFVMRITFNNYL
jgi:hypothetical protein